MRKTYKGNISISPFSGSDRGISISLEDNLSNTFVIRIIMSPLQWGEAITGRGYTECEFELGSLEVVGKKMEHKNEMIPCINPYNLDEKKIRKLLAPYEVDGWEGNNKDFMNHHRYKDGKISVSFYRWLDKEES